QHDDTRPGRPWPVRRLTPHELARLDDSAQPDYGPTGNEFNGTIAWVQLDIGDDDHDHLITPEQRAPRGSALWIGLQARPDFAFEELEEPGLIRCDLVDVDLVEAGI